LSQKSESRIQNKNSLNGGAQSILASDFWLRYSPQMFDIVRPQISLAADKLTHLRRFL